MNYLDFYSQRLSNHSFGANPFRNPVFAVVSVGALGMLFLAWSKSQGQLA
jgi:hypothetical protein